ncbi:DUF1592 domain-containing protein [Corallococcus terminator]|uniref:DUF1592 domain-containing protein n=1 Tax=Corallococcus terminator TaxID=2316733 RepID=UPI001FC9E993|nr:DUF1592 domain-containing protein [Corallococcus terminator]
MALRRRWWSPALLAVSVGLLGACEGQILDAAKPGGPGPGGNPGPGGPGNPPVGVEQPARSVRVARLTHPQWVASVKELLKLDAAPTTLAQSFRADPSQSGFLFDNDARALSVDEALWGAYQRAAADLAGQVATDATKLAKLLPPGTNTDEARAKAFVESFGMRAHRRPLTADEVESYLVLYRKGPTAYATMAPFQAGLRLVMEGFLQSPLFLYRVEKSTQAADGKVPLDAYEVASRLSYALWDSMPDEALFTAAREGALGKREGVAEQARRMMKDARARGVVGAYHQVVFDVPRYASIRPNTTRFPTVTAKLSESAAKENALFVDDVVFTREGRFSDLLTSRDTFVNDELARVYGLTGTFTADFVPATLDATQRRGVLTQVGFLASHATSMDPDPIHRGVFLSEHLLCQKIGAPPANIPALPAPNGRTNREVVTSHTEAPGTVCASCHSNLINPLGFPFENFDAVGGFRTTDNGHPVDATSSPSIGGEKVAVRDAVQLSDTLASSQAVHECYARHWVEFLSGRPAATEDAALVARLGKLSRAGELSVVDLVVEVVTGVGFVNRHPEELP